ncbi:type IV pilus modification PilV family protein [Burkholderia sp. 3C]
MAGSALLEVAIAMLLLAGATIAVLGAQLAMQRAASEAATRMRALRMADSWAELARSGSTSTIDLVRASAGLHDMQIDSTMRAAFAQVEVRWRRDVPASNDRVCSQGCVALAFSAGGER